MAPASLQLTLFEPVVFLRGLSAVGEDPRGRRRPINFDAPPSQLRGLVTLQLPKPSKIKEITITLQGKAKTDWPEGIGPTRIEASEESTIFQQKVVLFCAKDSQPSQYRKRASSIGTLQDELRESRHSVSRSYSNHTPPTQLPQASSTNERSPTLARSIGQAAARAGTAILPPTLMREINASKQGTSFASRSASSSPMRSPTSTRMNLQQRPSNSYFDPPPLYDSNRPTASSSSSSLHSNRASDELAPIESPELLDHAASTQHPQSVSAAGPSNRSILHPPGRQEAKLPSTAVAGAGVRFDGAQQSTVGFSAPGPSSTHSHSEPPSARTSAEQTRTSLQSNSKGKGKGKASSAATSPGHGAKKGIKGLLGNLLKEDDESHRTNGSSASNGHGASGVLEDDEANGGGGDDQEFRKGTYTFSFSMPLPANLPPTLHTDFGSNTYMVRAYAHRSGPLTSNLSSDKEITLVHAPDEDGQDDNDAIVVEREWEDCLRYVVFVMGKSFPVGSKIPVWIKFVPTEKVRIHRIIASLEERTVYYAKGRKITRHEVPRRWNLLKLVPPAENVKQGILPVISDSPDAIMSNPVAPYAKAAVDLYTEATNVHADDLLASLLDPFGPWELAMDLEVPIRSTPIVNISSNHTKSNIAVSHLVKLAIRVERIQGSDEERKLFDILIEAPVTINHSHTANAWLSLPTYWSVGERDRQSPVPAPSSSSSRAEEAASAPSLSALRRQTAPSLTPNRGLRGSVRVEAVNRATSPPPPPLQGRVNSNLVELSQQWLSLSVNDEVPSTIATSGTIVEPHAAAAAAQQMAEQQQRAPGDSGLPTYAMIDNARGSVDLPGRPVVKTSAR